MLPEKFQQQLTENTIKIKEMFEKYYKENLEAFASASELKGLLYNRFFIYTTFLNEQDLIYKLQTQLSAKEFFIFDQAVQQDERCYGLEDADYRNTFNSLEKLFDNTEYGIYYKLFIMMLPAFKPLFEEREIKNLFYRCSVSSLQHETDPLIRTLFKGFEMMLLIFSKKEQTEIGQFEN